MYFSFRINFIVNKEFKMLGFINRNTVNKKILNQKKIFVLADKSQVSRRSIADKSSYIKHFNLYQYHRYDKISD